MVIYMEPTDAALWREMRSPRTRYGGKWGGAYRLVQNTHWKLSFFWLCILQMLTLSSYKSSSADIRLFHHTTVVSSEAFPINQFHNHAQSLKVKNSGGPLDRQNGRLLHWPKCSCMSMKTKLWKLLLRPAVCMPSLIVQWPAKVSFLATVHDCETGLFRSSAARKSAINRSYNITHL